MIYSSDREVSASTTDYGRTIEIQKANDGVRVSFKDYDNSHHIYLRKDEAVKLLTKALKIAEEA